MSGRRSSRSALREAAAVGHRVTHEDDLPAPRQLVQVACDVAAARSGALHGQGGVLGSVMAAQLCRASAPADVDGDSPSCPDPCGEIASGAAHTLLGPERQPAALAHADHQSSCRDHQDGPAVQGAADVWIDGARCVRRGDEVDCGARVGEGAPGVLIGGATADAAERRPLERADGAPLGNAMALAAGGLDAGPALVGASLGAALAGGAVAAGGGGQGARGRGALGSQLALALAAGGRRQLAAELSGLVLRRTLT